MVGKKMFFIKAFLRSDKLRDQVSFDDFLSTYTKEKLTAFANSDIHNDRNNEKELSFILFKMQWDKDDPFFLKEAVQKMLDTVNFEIREHDVIARWDDEKFLIMLPECSFESGEKIAHLIKSICEAKSFVNMHVKLDYAITTHEEGDTPESLMNRLQEKLAQKCETV